MAFFTRSWRSAHEVPPAHAGRAAHRWLAAACCVPAVALGLALTACSEQNARHGFQITDLKARVRGQELQISLRQRLNLSGAAVNAVQNGVPLYISVDLEQRDNQTLDLLATSQQVYEIRYLPLSQHFQLSSPAGTPRTFPRLRHAIGALAELELSFPEARTGTGDYQLLARTRLVRSRLPPPMQLPAVLSSRWRHDSDWSQWPFRINA